MFHLAAYIFPSEIFPSEIFLSKVLPAGKCGGGKCPRPVVLQRRMISEIIHRVFPRQSPTFIFAGFADRLLSPEKKLRGLCVFGPLRETCLTQPWFSQWRKDAKVLPEARIGLGGR